MITEEMLIAAASEVNAALLASLPEPSECKYTFSSRFERRMRKLIHKENHPVIYRMMRYAACFILALFLGFMTLMAASPTVRAAVTDWIRTQIGAFTQYNFSENTANKANVEYELTYVPNGYVLEEIIKTPTQTSVLYTNHEYQKNLLLYYSKDNSVFHYSVKEHKYDIDSALVKNTHADLYLTKMQDENNAIIWLDKEHQYFLCIAAYVDQTELIKIAENVNQKIF